MSECLEQVWAAASVGVLLDDTLPYMTRREQITRRLERLVTQNDRRLNESSPQITRRRKRLVASNDLSRQTTRRLKLFLASNDF